MSVCCVTGPLSFAVDGKRVVDDFVLLTVLCGNDFIPHLPSLDIGKGALDLLLQSYRFVCAHLFDCESRLHDCGLIAHVCVCVQQAFRDTWWLLD